MADEYETVKNTNAEAMEGNRVRSRNPRYTDVVNHKWTSTSCNSLPVWSYSMSIPYQTYIIKCSFFQGLV